VKVALDTNVLAHAKGVTDADKHDVVLELVRRLSPEVLPSPFSCSANSSTCWCAKLDGRGRDP
jgi:hypothetical protein